jgi:hypothetical protein
MNIKREVTIRDISDFLNKKIQSYETKLLFEKMHKLNLHQNKNIDKSKDEELWAHNKINHSECDFEEKEEVCNVNNSKTNHFSPARYCWFHKNDSHGSYSCISLLAKHANEVKRLAKDNNICQTCGWLNHVDCKFKSSLECIIPNCEHNHATIFCDKRKVIGLSKQYKQDESEKSQLNISVDKLRSGTEKNHNNKEDCIDALNAQVSTCQSPQSWYSIKETLNVNNEENTASTLTAVIVMKLWNELENRKILCAILLDTGSTTSLIDHEYASLLGLKGPSYPINLTWSNNITRHDSDSSIVKVKAKGIQKDSKIFDLHFRTLKDLCLGRQNFNAQKMQEKYSHLANIELMSYSKVIGIIGMDQAWNFQPSKVIESDHKENNNPIAILYPLGYAVMGSCMPLESLYKNLSENNLSNINCTHIDKLDDKRKKLNTQGTNLVNENGLGFVESVNTIHDNNISSKCSSKKVILTHTESSRCDKNKTKKVYKLCGRNQPTKINPKQFSTIIDPQGLCAFYKTSKYKVKHRKKMCKNTKKNEIIKNKSLIEITINENCKKYCVTVTKLKEVLSVIGQIYLKNISSKQDLFILTYDSEKIEYLLKLLRSKGSQNTIGNSQMMCEGNYQNNEYRSTIKTSPGTIGTSAPDKKKKKKYIYIFCSVWSVSFNILSYQKMKQHNLTTLLNSNCRVVKL